MRQKLKYIVKVDGKGNFIGPAVERIRPELKEVFAGQFVTVTIEGYENPKSDEMRGYYYAVVAPLMVQGLRDCGYRIDVKESERVERKKVEAMVIAKTEGIEMIKEVVNGETRLRLPEMKELNATNYRLVVDGIMIFMDEFLGITDIPKPRKKRS